MRKVLIPILLPECIYRLCIWLVLLYRRLRYGYTFRRIPLTRGQFAIVDVADYEELAQHKWFALWYGSGYYAGRVLKVKEGRGRQQHVRMHRELIDVPAGKFIDHINHNGLDNRKANLRIVTRRENSWNKRKQRGNYSSQYKGVTWLKRTGKWQARIVCKGTSIFIGQFDDEKAAARAYDARAAELFGEYAALNFRRRC